MTLSSWETILQIIHKPQPTEEKDEDRARLQEALDKLCSWASKWGMVFNVAKCKEMHMGSRYPGFIYTIDR